ncbi:hypothetical protein AB0L41_28155 [Amycolatopsis mediterranei]|uniref:hypothetical protein n=1 Tax=Amycolatopsis mediterranei TaxID=33910 RepID=UPI00342CFD1A
MKLGFATRKSFTGLIVSLLAVLGVFAAPAVSQASTSAAYPVTSFRLEYGATVLAGSITWYNRNIGIVGSLRARSSGKQAHFRAGSASCSSAATTGTVPADTTGSFDIGMNCDFPGGFTWVTVQLWDASGTYLDGVTCTRDGC